MKNRGSILLSGALLFSVLASPGSRLFEVQQYQPVTPAHKTAESGKKMFGATSRWPGSSRTCANDPVLCQADDFDARWRSIVDETCESTKKADKCSASNFIITTVPDLCIPGFPWSSINLLK